MMTQGSGLPHGIYHAGGVLQDAMLAEQSVQGMMLSLSMQLSTCLSAQLPAPKNWADSIDIKFAFCIMPSQLR